MAAGDVVSGAADIADGSELEYQPAAGVETFILFAGGHQEATVIVRLSNGAIYPQVIKSSENASAQLRLPVNNSIYLRISNGAGAARTVGYSGIQTK